MNKKFFLLLMVTLFMISCVYDHNDNKQDLGNGFYYLGDGSESQILINVSEDKNKTVGRTIVPGEVTDYNFDENTLSQKIELTKTDWWFKIIGW